MLPVSVCIIVKNEEKRLPRCLDSLSPYPFEIVIADTGSTDGTKEAAAAYTDKIFDFAWRDDFAAARNFSIEKASNDWILILDSDEAVESLDMDELAYFQEHLSHASGSVNRINLVGSPENPSQSIDRTERFFNRRLYYYTGRIHEQLTPRNGGEMESFLLKLSLLHDGYLMTEAERLEKARRNLSLLQMQLKEEPETPYLCYQLGKAYEMLGDWQKTCELMRRGLAFCPDVSLAYVQAMMVEYGDTLLKTGEKEAALAFLGSCRSLPDTADFHYLSGRIYKENRLYQQAADEFVKAAEYDFANKTGANSFLALYQLGSLFVLTADFDRALSFFRLCGDYGPAKKGIKMIEDALKGEL